MDERMEHFRVNYCVDVAYLQSKRNASSKQEFVAWGGRMLEKLNKIKNIQRGVFQRLIALEKLYFGFK